MHAFLHRLRGLQQMSNHVCGSELSMHYLREPDLLCMPCANDEDHPNRALRASTLFSSANCSIACMPSPTHPRHAKPRVKRIGTHWLAIQNQTGNPLAQHATLGVIYFADTRSHARKLAVALHT